MIYIVVALQAEARPLISHFGLERADDLAPLEVFQRPDLKVVVTGVGQAAVEAAVDALQSERPVESHSVWLNLGVAGNRNRPIGTEVLAAEVVDQSTGRSWTLIPPKDYAGELGTVYTVRHVEVDYATQALYEMEAAAFCERVMRLTSPELVQVLKVVSDNLETGAFCVSAHQVQGLLEKSLPRIDRLVSSLHRRARQLGSV